MGSPGVHIQNLREPKPASDRAQLRQDQVRLERLHGCRCLGPQLDSLDLEIGGQHTLYQLRKPRLVQHQNALQIDGFLSVLDRNLLSNPV